MPTREQFEAYVKVQRSGHWNMLMNAEEAAREAGLDLDTYFEVIKNYSKLAAEFKVWKWQVDLAMVDVAAAQS